MSEQSERFRRVAAEFTAKVDGVSDWDAPAPVDGWVARDVVGHLVEWVPSLFYGAWGLDSGAAPTVEEDPGGAWAAMRDTLQAALDDPAVADEVRDLPPGAMSFAAAIDMLVTNDVFLHTWDLARATGQDERLDAAEVHDLLVGMEPMDEMLRQSGHYGPRVPVPDDADEQTKLIAFIGRQP